jgi:SAM-dependent methyltransferase
MARSSLKVTARDLERVFQNKYGDDVAAMAWGPRIRSRFGHFTPDDYYEATVSRLVTSGCVWLDVGSGRHVFPSNRRLARKLGERCGVLVGVDPDETINENDVVHERVQQRVEEFRSERAFDIVTLRMAAEHVTDPEGVAAALARLTGPGGRVVVYTINRWSPVPMITWLTPFRWHHLLKQLLWHTERKDTFPVAYRMNTRRALREVFGKHGFREAEFGYLDDCRTFGGMWGMQVVELCVWRCLRALRIRYPENCLLGVYERCDHRTREERDTPHGP